MKKQQELTSKFNNLDLSTIEEELKKKVNLARQIITSYEPLALLKYGYEHFAVSALGKMSESEWSIDENNSRRMIDYVQSVIVSSELQSNLKEIVDDEEYKKLFELIKDIYLNVTLFYNIAQTRKKQKNKNYDFDLDEFRTMTVMYWVNVCGKRHSYFEFIHLKEILKPHQDIIKEIFNITLDELIDEFKKIKNSVEQGYVKQWQLIREAIEKISENSPEKLDFDNIESLKKELNKHPDYDIAALIVKMQSCDFFDIQQVSDLPQKLIDALSFEPNESNSFFDGEHAGLPLKKIPIKERPFLKYQNKYYCFETSHFFDNLYRNLENVILKEKPSYFNSWNTRQGKVCQKIVLDLFKKILPNASFYDSNYYLYNNEWTENDGLILFDDNIIVLEIKAGKFKTKSPFSDFNSYMDSIQRLLTSPVEQADRITSTVDKYSEIAFYENEDIQSKLKLKLTKKDTSKIYICSVSLENFNTFANNVPMLRKVGFNIPDKPVWSLSIDELRIYADLFNNDITFVHFLKERMLASQSDIVDLNDELEHLGLYFSYNKYVQHIQELQGEYKAAKISIEGYIEDIDKYYLMLEHYPEEAIKPTQNITERFAEIISILNKNNQKYCSSAVCKLLDFSGEGRSHITNMIEQVLKEQFTTRRSKHLEIYGMSAFCKQDDIPFLSQEEINDIIYASMIIQNKEERLSLIIFFDKDNKVYDTKITKYTLELSDENKKKYSSQVETLKARRFTKILTSGKKKIGRNDRCPCGSGKKYKNCCLR